MSSFVCKSIAPEQTWPLRELVLRPGLPMSAYRWDGDELETTHHFGAGLHHFDAGSGGAVREGAVLAIASLYERDHAIAPGPNAWQLRGMAVHPDHRGRGLGGAILTHVIEHCRIRLGGRVIWCNARTPATTFYRRHGFTSVGDEFLIEGVGPHFVMYRAL